MLREVGTVVLLMAALAGCSSSGSGGGKSAAASGSPEAEVTSAAAAPAGYWTADKLLAAQEFRPEGWTGPAEGQAPAARQNAKTLRVGAIFTHDSTGNHFCTGSVVNSPGEDLIVTAAHCLNDGKGGQDKQDVAFVPAYADGKAPFGEWQPDKYVIDSRWVNSHDERLDVAFVVLKPLDGKKVQQVLGANTMEFNAGHQHDVRVTGYPGSADAPVDCENMTSAHGQDYLRFECAHFYGGTSGSPWVTRYDQQTRTGTVVGVLGGYQEGGDTPDVSYSDYLGNDIENLYQRAISG